MRVSCDHRARSWLKIIKFESHPIPSSVAPQEMTFNFYHLNPNSFSLDFSNFFCYKALFIFPFHIEIIEYGTINEGLINYLKHVIDE